MINFEASINFNCLEILTMDCLKEKSSTCLNTLSLQISHCFFCKIPLNFINQEVFSYIASNQSIFLKDTLLSKTNLKYPLSKSYQINFLKDVIHTLETKNVEIEENVYITYINLLETKSNFNTYYSYFPITGNRYIHIKEKGRIISDGTTGLTVWQGGKILANYCIDNSYIFREKSILELGCGLGLTGLAVILCCEPKNYYFTDAHCDVLNFLKDNICSNLRKELVTNNDNCYKLSHVQYFGKYKSTSISVIDFDWSNNADDIVEFVNADIILAADVIYDLNLFECLCRTVTRFLKKKASCNLIFSCTIRNADTLDKFIFCLRKFNLQEVHLHSVKTWDTSYNCKCEVEIFQIQYNEEIV